MELRLTQDHISALKLREDGPRRPQWQDASLFDSQCNNAGVSVYVCCMNGVFTRGVSSRLVGAETNEPGAVLSDAACLGQSGGAVHSCCFSSFSLVYSPQAWMTGSSFELFFFQWNSCAACIFNDFKEKVWVFSDPHRYIRYIAKSVQSPIQIIGVPSLPCP